MFKPLIPIISDVWDHEFNEIEHISIVHAKYGSHHLQKEVADSGSDNSQKGQGTLKSEDQVPFHISSGEPVISYSASASDKPFAGFMLNKILAVSIPLQGPPPKFS